MEGRFLVEVSDVSFYLTDLQILFPKSFDLLDKPQMVSNPSSAPAVVEKARTKGGRKLSPSWPQWVAEVVAHIHENGIPDGEGASGVDVMLKTVADRLAERGLEGPARTTSQETMRAVLLRLRGAGN